MRGGDALLKRGYEQAAGYNRPMAYDAQTVVAGAELGDVSVTDNAPAILWALGIPPARTGPGMARLDAFGFPMFEAEIE
jgi:hypothetical protein